MSLTDRPVDRLGDEVSGVLPAANSEQATLQPLVFDPAKVDAYRARLIAGRDEAQAEHDSHAEIADKAWNLYLWYADRLELLDERLARHAGQETVPKGTKTPLEAPLEPLQHIAEGRS